MSVLHRSVLLCNPCHVEIIILCFFWKPKGSCVSSLQA
uniref:Uncharacterized protein n=1 Tax=Rhizophora mucronata TaxID=61149 RepID=A0A2P2QZC5_RHIMU